MKKPKNNLPPDEYLVAEFNKGLRQWGKDSDAAYEAGVDKKWNVFRISEIGECQAAITRDWLGQGKEKDLQSLLRLHDGKWTHDSLRELFTLSDLKLIHKERELRKKYVVKLEGGVVKVPVELIGHQDNAFMYDEVEITVDFKKASEHSFDKMAEGNLSDAYFDQLQGYMDVANSPLGILFAKGVHGAVAAITVERDEDYFSSEVLPRLARTALLRKRKQVGRREFSFGLPPCTYCRHLEQCWTVDAKMEDREIALSLKDPRSKEVISAHDLDEQARLHDEKAKAFKADARNLAIEILKKARSKRIRIADGRGITWTSFSRKTVSLLSDKKLEAVKQGFAKESQSSVEYPLFTGRKSSE